MNPALIAALAYAAALGLGGVIGTAAWFGFGRRR